MKKMVFLSFLICLFFTSCDLNEQIKINQDRGNVIIQALDEFYSDNNSFPKQLDELLPKYLIELPEPIIGRGFDYTDDHLQGYYLCFKPNYEKRLLCCYNHRLGLWDCSRGD